MKVTEMPDNYKGNLLELEMDMLPGSPRLGDCTFEQVEAAAAYFCNKGRELCNKGREALAKAEKLQKPKSLRRRLSK